MERSYESLSKAIEALTKEGYTIDFNLVDEGIESKHLKERWTASQCEVVRFFRFEGMTSTDDSSILYAIKTKDGKKGLLVDSYGVYAGQISEEMLKKLKVH
ncbi:phosphoribosylpyrophosphate synthetase [Sungkyunkwania multivorans]|uniref:Phosphoribosylpyrophosphate synthetase n=1 Tax=Sungkyunkwania multivorans TaxID=1173618 RepID=A0ABW3D526_9FLAO